MVVTSSEFMKNWSKGAAAKAAEKFSVVGSLGQGVNGHW